MVTDRDGPRGLSIIERDQKPAPRHQIQWPCSPDASGIAAAYLLAPDESNSDATNYWIFTTAGLRRLFDRTGWNVLVERHLGDIKTSNPQDNARDERLFAILERR